MNTLWGKNALELLCDLMLSVNIGVKSLHSTLERIKSKRPIAKIHNKPFHWKHMGCILVHRPPFPKFSFLQLYWNRSDEGLSGIPVLFLKWSFLSLLTNEISSVLMTSRGPHLSWWHHHFSCGSSFSAYDVYPRLQTHWRPGLFVSLDHDGIHQPPCLFTKVSLIKIQFIQYVFYPFFFLVEKTFFLFKSRLRSRFMTRYYETT